jgi:hypothetical protein
MQAKDIGKWFGFLEEIADVKVELSQANRVTASIFGD